MTRYRNASSEFYDACVSHRNLHYAKHLLEHGADLNTRDMNGSTPLHVACYDACHDKDKKVVLFLIQHGANTSTINRHGSTPLLWACHYEMTDVALSLIEHGADFAYVMRHKACDGEIKETLQGVLSAYLVLTRYWSESKNIISRLPTLCFKMLLEQF